MLNGESQRRNGGIWGKEQLNLGCRSGKDLLLPQGERRRLWKIQNNAINNAKMALMPAGSTASSGVAFDEDSDMMIGRTAKGRI